MDDAWLDQRPVIVALAGPNGAGKSTFYEAHLQRSGLRFINADELARALGIDVYRAAEAAERLRNELVADRESFVFETVFSDPAQQKVSFLKAAAAQGYAVVLCFVGLESAELSDQRVTLRALSGGHDVPRDKLIARYPRSLRNLEHALRGLPFVRVFDNSVFGRPHRQIAEFRAGSPVQLVLPLPKWFAPVFAAVVDRAQQYAVERVTSAHGLVTLVLTTSAGSHTRITIANSKRSYRTRDRVQLRVTSERVVLTKAK